MSSRFDRGVLFGALALVIAWTALLFYAYPGYISYDSMVQLRQARDGSYGDWHPPVMAAIWRLTELVIRGPLGMLVLQSGLLVAGLYLVLRAHVTARTALWVSALCLVFPPVITAFAVIWKDCLMIGALLAATGLLLVRGRAAIAASLVLFVIGTAARYNAFTITAAPIVLLFHPIASLRGVRRYALSAVTWLAVTGAAIGLNGRLTDVPEYPWHRSAALFDIVGVLRFAPSLDDAAIRDYLAGVQVIPTTDLPRAVKSAYDPAEGMFGAERMLRAPTTPAERDAIARAWTRLVTDHPLAYLWHRWRAFREMIGLSPKPKRVQHVWVGIHDYAADLVSYKPNAVQARIQGLGWSVGRSWLVHAYLYLYLVLALTALAIAWRHRVAIALGASGLLSEAALFFLTPTPDFRYSLWLVVITIPMICILFAHRYRREREPGSAVGRG